MFFQKKYQNRLYKKVFNLAFFDVKYKIKKKEAFYVL